MESYDTDDRCRSAVLGRRAFVGGLAVTALTGSVAVAAVSDEARFALGSVVETTGNRRLLTIRSGPTVYAAAARDFPEQWEFRAGDWVGLDLVAREAYPYLVSSGVRPDGRYIYTMPNNDHRLDRLVLSD